MCLKKSQLTYFLGLLLFSNSIYSQGWVETVESQAVIPITRINDINQLGPDSEHLRGNEYEWSKVMGLLFQFDDISLAKKGFDGSIFLFDEWENKSTVIANKKKFIFPNLNYNIERDKFMFKHKDSTFIFDMNKIERVSIRNKVFKPLNVEGVQGNYQVIFNNKQISILKKYSLVLSKASPNPMVNRTRSKIKRKSKYFLEKENSLNPFALKKKSFLNLTSKNHHKKIKAFVKENKLYYKEEKDIGQIISYILTL
ncbi:hypothetical protein OD91_2280 [Lutibacter sp. Hel_I_33_5]|nr:hypothetical protein OD91_2280 [Lutibacter sp. Hel_I_33_5]